MHFQHLQRRAKLVVRFVAAAVFSDPEQLGVHELDLADVLVGVRQELEIDHEVHPPAARRRRVSVFRAHDDDVGVIVQGLDAARHVAEAPVHEHAADHVADVVRHVEVGVADRFHRGLFERAENMFGVRRGKVAARLGADALQHAVENSLGLDGVSVHGDQVGPRLPKVGQVFALHALPQG